MLKKVTKWLIAAMVICGMVGSATAAYALTIKSNAAQRPEIFPQLGHTGGVNSVVISPDGRFALSGSGDKTLRLWDVATGKEIRAFTGHANTVASVAFSPDGMIALSGSHDKTLRLWDVATGKEIRALDGHKHFVESIAFSPNGKFALSGSWDKTMRLWDVATGKEMRTFVGHTDYVLSVAFSPDGKFALSGSRDRTLRLWNVKTGKEMRIFAGHAVGINSIAFSPDGRFVLSSDEYSMRLWDVATGKEMRIFAGHAGLINSIAFSPDGRVALSGGSDAAVRLWDTATGKEIRKFIGHTNYVLSVSFSPDGRYALSAGADNTPRLWDVATGKEVQQFKGYTTKIVWDVSFSPDGRFVLLGGMDSLRLWDVTTGRQMSKQEAKYNEEVTFLAFSSNSKLALLRRSAGDYATEYNTATTPFSSADTVLARKDKTLHIWDVATGKEIRTFTGKAGVISPDGRTVLSHSRDKTMRLWDVATGKEMRTFVGHTDYVESVAFSPDGKFALSGSHDHTLRLWDVDTGKEIRLFPADKKSVFPVAFSPDGKFVLSGRYNRDYPSWTIMSLWDVATGKEMLSSIGREARITSIAFSPDERVALSGGSDAAVRLWDTATGKEIQTFAGHTYSIKSVALSSDGKHALSGSGDRTIRLWDVATGKEIRQLKGCTKDVTSVAFSPDGKFALAKGCDDIVRFWDVATGKEIQKFMGYTSNYIEFSPDGRQVLSGSWAGIPRLLDIHTGRELAQFITFADGEWIAITPEGYFNASPNGTKHLNVRVGNNVYGIDQFYSRFYRPELVELALAGKEVKATEDIGALAKRSPAPTVSLIAPLSDVSVNKETITVKVTVKDNGGGIGDIVVYRNGVQVGNKTRGVSIKAKKGVDEIFPFDVSLSEGQNSIRIVAMNKEGSMESVPAEVNVTANIKKARPNLYAVVVGIDEYKNKSIALKFAVSDATEFADVLKAKARPLFDQVRVTVLIKPEETTSEAIRKALMQAAVEVKPDDVFIFFNASHGVIEQLEGLEQYYLITSNVLLLSSDRVAQAALSQKELASLIGSISAQKKIIFLDTCHAGKAGKQIQLALLEQRTRGLTESTAIKLLQRAVGSSVFAASLDRETAMEGYKGHGLFTYVLLEGMNGKADIKKEGYITVNGLKYFMEEEIITLSEKVFNRQQTPVIEAGANFPFGKVQ